MNGLRESIGNTEVDVKPRCPPAGRNAKSQDNYGLRLAKAANPVKKNLSGNEPQTKAAIAIPEIAAAFTRACFKNVPADLAGIPQGLKPLVL
jgi:hypothetical protein